MAIQEQDITLVLMNQGNYPLAGGGTANFVVGMKEVLDEGKEMNASDTNAGGWDATELRSWLNSEIYNMLPQYIRSIIKKMNAWTANGGRQAGTIGVYSEDYLSLSAEKEILGNNVSGNSSIESQLFQFEWYKTAANHIKNGAWWTRSPSIERSDFHDGLFCEILPNGNSDEEPAESKNLISFIGCI